MILRDKKDSKYTNWIKAIKSNCTLLQFRAPFAGHGQSRTIAVLFLPVWLFDVLERLVFYQDILGGTNRSVLHLNHVKSKERNKARIFTQFSLIKRNISNSVPFLSIWGLLIWFSFLLMRFFLIFHAKMPWI